MKRLRRATGVGVGVESPFAGRGEFWLVVRGDNGVLDGNFDSVWVTNATVLEEIHTVRNAFLCKVLGSDTLSFKVILSRFLSPVSHSHSH